LKRSDPRSGIVLVTVLWAIALLSALAVATSTTFRGYAGILAVDRNRVEADALLNAGLEASADLIAKLGDRPLTARETSLTLSTGTVHLRMQDEGGRIDVNKAPVEVLASAMQAVGIAEANILARAIASWRERDQGGKQSAAPNANSANGNLANKGVVIPAGNGNAPLPAGDAEKKDSAFQSFTDLRQLAQVPGMTADYLAALMPLMTVFGGDKVNALTAPESVLAALPGLSRAQVAALLEARRHLPIAENRREQLLGQAQAYMTLQARPIAAVELTARLVDGYTTGARAIIMLLPRDKQPYRLLAWTPLTWTPLSFSSRGGPVADRL
jgi:general secretion pathway protein K